tara:strand:- start:6217 stop:7509 length:1293 start_codon:yes stop_codon:yes gene_type:complete
MINKYYNIGKKILFPINRSITGSGIVKSLNILKRIHPDLKINYFKSNTKVFDWTVPEEWNVKEAYVQDTNKKRIIDFKKNNLHLVGYSRPIKMKITKKSLLKKIYVSRLYKDAIPYVTSYYKKDWGFCTTRKHKNEINKRYGKNEKFKILIKSNFKKKNGKMPFGEFILPGKSKQEILISTYICHPSMANNELSGPLLSMMLIEYFKRLKLQKTLKFIFIPETIGSIAYINRNKNKLNQIIGAFNLSCVGDDRNYSCMLSKFENSPSDNALITILKKNKIKYKKYSFNERGSDERQFNWPGIDVPMTSFFRTKYNEFPEYHTSKDTFGKVVTKHGLRGSFKIMKQAISVLLKNRYPVTNVLCEPKMDKRGLYSYISALGKNLKYQRKLIDFLMYSDGKNDIDLISKKINLNKKITLKLFKILLKQRLIDI